MTTEEITLRQAAIDDAFRQVVTQLSKNFFDKTMRLEQWRDGVNSALARRQQMLSEG